MAVRGDITREKDFHLITAWIDRKRQLSYISLAVMLLISVVWTWKVSKWLSMGVIVIQRRSSTVLVPSAYGANARTWVFVTIVAILVFCGAAHYFIRKYSRRDDISDSDWSRIIHSEWMASGAGRGCLLDAINGGYPFVSAYQHFFITMFGFFLTLLGPGIFVNALLGYASLLEMRREAPRRQAAIVLLKLFRLGGVSVALETFDLESLSWGKKMVFFAKLQKLRWVYLCDNLHEARLEPAMESHIRQALGYR